MKMVRKWGLFMFLATSLTLGLMSCSDDDENYEDVTPPSVEMSNSITGVISTKNGNVLAGVTVVLSDGTQQTTDAQGHYSFNDVKPGSYTLTASKEGYATATGEVAINDNNLGETGIWNGVLLKNGSTIKVTIAGVNGGTETEVVANNDVAVIPINVTAEEGAVSGTDELVLTPIYSLNDINLSALRTVREKERTILAGAILSSPNASAKLEKPLSLTFSVDKSVQYSVEALQLQGGSWNRIACTANNGIVSIEADALTAYALAFLPLEEIELPAPPQPGQPGEPEPEPVVVTTSSEPVTTTSTSSVGVAFQPSSWDNLYGNAAMKVESSSYTYKTGSIVTKSDEMATAGYMLEIASRVAFAVGVMRDIQAEYPLNVTLPIGTSMSISGVQNVRTTTTTTEVTTITLYADGRREEIKSTHSASITSYGIVSISVSTSNRQHTGGGSK